MLCCFALFVCLTLLASFFLTSHLSFKTMYMYMYMLYDVLLCLVCLLPLLASFFLSSHLSFKTMYMYICIILHSWKSYTMYTCILDCQDCPEIDLAAQYKKCEPKQLPPSSVLKHFHQCFSEHMSELYM